MPTGCYVDEGCYGDNGRLIIDLMEVLITSLTASLAPGVKETISLLVSLKLGLLFHVYSLFFLQVCEYSNTNLLLSAEHGGLILKKTEFTFNYSKA